MDLFHIKRAQLNYFAVENDDSVRYSFFNLLHILSNSNYSNGNTANNNDQNNNDNHDNYDEQKGFERVTSKCTLKFCLTSS